MKQIEKDTLVIVVMPPVYYGQGVKGLQLLIGIYQGKQLDKHIVHLTDANNQKIILPCEDNQVYLSADAASITHEIQSLIKPYEVKETPIIKR